MISSALTTPPARSSSLPADPFPTTSRLTFLTFMSFCVFVLTLIRPACANCVAAVGVCGLKLYPALRARAPQAVNNLVLQRTTQLISFLHSACSGQVCKSSQPCMQMNVLGWVPTEFYLQIQAPSHRAPLSPNTGEADVV